jgi:hypothetical protein
VAVDVALERGEWERACCVTAGPVLAEAPGEKMDHFIIYYQFIRRRSARNARTSLEVCGTIAVGPRKWELTGVSP